MLGHVATQRRSVGVKCWFDFSASLVGLVPWGGTSRPKVGGTSSGGSKDTGDAVADEKPGGAHCFSILIFHVFATRSVQKGLKQGPFCQLRRGRSL